MSAPYIDSSVGNTVDSVFRPVPSPIGCRPSAACRWGRTSAAPPERTSAARTGKLACASPAAPASGCAPCLAAAGAVAWQCCLRLQRCCRCCPLRCCADGGASVGGAGGVCICFIGKSVLVVSQKTLRGMDAVACGMSSTTIVQIALTCEREMPTAGRTVGASRSVSPGPPRSPWAHASVKRNCISCQPGARARRV